MKSKIINATNAMLSIGLLSLIGIFSGAEECIIPEIKNVKILSNFLYYIHTGNGIILNVSAGIFGGICVWFFSVKIPETALRRKIRDILYSHHKALVQELYTVYLIALHQNEECQTFDVYKFRESYAQNKNKWMECLNEDDSEYLKRIIISFKKFERKVMPFYHLASKLDLSIISSVMEISSICDSFTYDSKLDEIDIKLIESDVFSILSSHSRNDGYIKKNFIEQYIDRV